MAICDCNVEAEGAVIDARRKVNSVEEVDDLINVLENQLDYLYYFHKFKLEGRQTVLIV